eukprot:TRINITY_DN9441_c0_g2_i5.p1 TRINITY_DN9441_c0_g2~~TRINITY_DN9441_c0_g2_i5.p1  ORF type:complete len:509 (-),score=223.27 TRINITY_DN9441_c0_g2_i5:433-1959(-)
MQIMEKYIAKEAPETPTGGIEKEFMESLVVQLKQKDIERDTMIDYVSKIEHENEELSERITEIERTYEELMAERQREKVEFEEYKAMGEGGTLKQQRERYMEEEIESLSKELKAEKLAADHLRKDKDEEIERLRDELAEAKRATQSNEENLVLIEQLKRKIGQLTEDKQSLSSELDKNESLQVKFNSLEKEKKLLEETNLALNESIYKEKMQTRKFESELKASQDEIANLKKEYKLLEEKLKFAERQIRSSEEALTNLKTETEEEVIHSSVDSELSLQKEIKYQTEIGRLKSDLEKIQAAAEDNSKSRIAELEAIQKNLAGEISVLQDSLAAANKRANDLEKENEDYQSQINRLRKGNEIVAENMKEYERIKKDKETLLELAKRAQDNLAELEELRKLEAELKKENTSLKSELANSKEEKAKADEGLKKLNELKVQLEKEIAKSNEKITVFQEERLNMDRMMNEIQKGLGDNLGKNAEEELEKLKAALKKKYKEKKQKLRVLVLELKQ